MALFRTKKNTEAAPATPAAAKKEAARATIGRSLSAILRNPRITEKATVLQGASVYTFDIAESATKRDVLAAVQSLYKVSPTKVRVVPVPKKVTRNMRTGKSGVKTGGKKAYVYLKQGETITIS